MTDATQHARDLRFALAAVLVVLVGWIDYATGTEIRVHALYFVPLTIGAYYARGRGAVFLAAFCSVVWLGAYRQAGGDFSSPEIYVLNTLLQATAFLTVGMLVASLRTRILRERELARCDTLTLLPNSRAFYERATKALTALREQPAPMTVAYLDLDNFKAVNDTQGHQVGDLLLCEIADVLRASIRKGDTVARLGGDEFVILMPDTAAKDGEVALTRIRAQAAERMSHCGWPVTLSVGAVVFERPPKHLNELINSADSLMYNAKALGKNALRIEVVRDAQRSEESAALPQPSLGMHNAV